MDARIEPYLFYVIRVCYLAFGLLVILVILVSFALVWLILCVVMVASCSGEDRATRAAVNHARNSQVMRIARAFPATSFMLREA